MDRSHGSDSDLIGPSTAAMILGVTVQSIGNFRRRGQLRGVTRGGVRMLRADSVLRLKATRALARRTGRPTVAEVMRAQTGEPA